MHQLENTLIVYMVSKREVLMKDFTSILEKIKELAELKRDGRSKLVIMIDGYNDTPDELFEIKEVREWVQELVAYVPYFLYFIHFDLNHQVYLLASLGDTESFHAGPHQWGAPKALMIKLHDRFYYSMKKGIESYCDSLGDPKAKAELLNEIERFY